MAELNKVAELMPFSSRTFSKNFVPNVILSGIRTGKVGVHLTAQC
jgi:hypothetical protein